MDIKPPINSFVKKIEENARKIFSSLDKDNGGNCSPQKNFMSVEVKKEESDDEIQEYAATTISELLGWYGYDKVDSGCTKRLNLDHFTSTSNARHNQMHQMDQNIIPTKLASRDSSNTFNFSPDISNLPLPCSTTINRQFSPLLELKTATLNTTSKFPYKNCISSIFSDNTITCSGCGRMTKVHASGETNSLAYSTINALGHFCSEACFIAGRKTVFKGAKTCDWCRHIRNPITYVGFQDGESQLEFCSDRCLNQYKINIFCHETQTHLMLQGLNNVSFHDTEKGSLITPELWFRNCQSPLNNPTEDTFVTDNNLSCNLSSTLLKNETKEMEHNKNEESESSVKTSRKRDLIYIKKHKKNNNYSEEKINFCRGMDENDVNEYIKEQALANAENKFCHFMGNQNHCSINILQKDNINYKSFKKNCNLMDVINYNSCSRQQNDGVTLGNDIHIQNLQKDKDHNSLDDILRLSPWFSTATASLTQCKLPLLSTTYMHQFHQTVNHNAIRVSPTVEESSQVNSPTHSLPAAILPSVAVLTPYSVPIPIPIPIPIPVFLPAPIISDCRTDKQESFSITENIKYKDIKCQDLLENKSHIPKKFELNKNEIVTATKSLKHKTSKSKERISPSFNNNVEQNDNLYQLKQNTKPCRKRKRVNETIKDKHENLKLKKKK